MIKKAYFKYISSLLLFGSNGIVSNHIKLSSYEIVFLRTLIASLLLLGIFIFTGGRFNFWRNKRQLCFLAGSGIAMGCSWMFLYEAYQQLGVSLASLLYYCGPVIVMALSTAIFREKMTLPKILGVVIVMCGIYLVNGKIMSEGQGGWGVFCGIMSAVMYSFMVILNKKATKITGLENPAIQLAASFVTVALFVGFKQGYAIHASCGEWGWIAVLGIINTGIGCYFFFSSIGFLPVQTVAILGYLELVSAVVFAAVFLHESMSPVQIAGALLVICGAMIGECVSIKA